MNPEKEIFPIRVLHIISGDLWAGAEVQVYHTLRTLSRKGKLIISCVLFNDGILLSNLNREHIETILIDEKKVSTFGMLRGLIRFIHRNKPEIIHVHAVKEHFFGKLISFLSFRSLPIVRTVHGENSVPEGIPFFRKIRAMMVVSLDRFLKKNMSDAVIAVTKDLERRFISDKYKGDIHQIYNAVDTANQLDESAKGLIRKQFITADVFWVGTAARLEEIKNIQMLIKAGSYLHERGIPFKISIFGEGALKNTLQDLINVKGLDKRITLHGFQPDVVPIIQSLDAFVLCSFHEGLPMALLEAMSGAIPVVCTSVGGMKEIVQHDKNGLLVDSDDSKSLAEALITLYDDREKTARLADNARRTVVDSFSLLKAATHLSDIYHQLNEHHAPRNTQI